MVYYDGFERQKIELCTDVTELQGLQRDVEKKKHVNSPDTAPS